MKLRRANLGRQGWGPGRMVLARALFFSLLAAPSLANAAERVVSTPAGAAALFGTLDVPDRPANSGVAALILAGSGPTDRDGNSAMGPAPNELKQLADALALAGVTSLRIDKRGVGASAAAAPAERDLRLETYVADAAGWVSWLRAQPGVRCVVLVGHSEGAFIAFLAAERTNVCGVVSLEGPGRPLAEVLKGQLERQLQDPLRSRALAVLDELASGMPVADPPAELAALFRPSVQPYVISELSVDPAQEIKKFQGPLLIVQGSRDQNVTLEDFERLKAARPDAATLLVPGMVHPLKIPPSLGETVGFTNLPLAPGVSEALVRFVASLTPLADAGPKR